MKIKILNYTFDASAKTISFDDYVADGIDLENVLFINNATDSVVLFNLVDPTLKGTVTDNVLTLNASVDTSAMADTDKLLIYYEDPLASQQVESTEPLTWQSDDVTTRQKGRKYVRLTASGVVSAVPAQLVGCFVASLSGGSIKLWDNDTTGSGDVIINTWTPDRVGWHDFGGIEENISLGIYATLASTIDVTFVIDTAS